VPVRGRPDRIRHPSARSAAPDGWSRQIPVSSSALPARPPQPSWRMRSRISRISMSPRGMCVSEIIRSLTQRSHTMRRNHDGNAGTPVAARPGLARPMAAGRCRSCASAVAGPACWSWRASALRIGVWFRRHLSGAQVLRPLPPDDDGHRLLRVGRLITLLLLPLLPLIQAQVR
jgi:hypothetical protein